MTVDYSVIGWLGAIIYLLAYFLLSIGVLLSNKPLFHLLNAVAGVFLVINSVFLDDHPNFVLNLLWAIIAVGSIIQIIRKSKKKLLANS